MTQPICANLDQHQGGELSAAPATESVDCRECARGYDFQPGAGYRCAQAEVRFSWDAVASDPCAEFRPKSAPQPPPSRGAGLAEAGPTKARDQNAGVDFDRGVYVAAKLAVDMSTGYAGDDPRSRALMDFVECLFQYYPGGKRARDTEEALAKARREAAEAILADREIVFGTEKAQAAVMRWARAELGSAP